MPVQYLAEKVFDLLLAAEREHRVGQVRLRHEWVLLTFLADGFFLRTRFRDVLCWKSLDFLARMRDFALESEVGLLMEGYGCSICQWVEQGSQMRLVTWEVESHLRLVVPRLLTRSSRCSYGWALLLENRAQAFQDPTALLWLVVDLLVERAFLVGIKVD